MGSKAILKKTNNKLRYGLSEDILKDFSLVFDKFSDIKKVILFGSRAKETFSLSSDIDLAIDAPSMNSAAYTNLWSLLDELPIVFKLDVLHLQSLNNDKLLESITKDGVIFYENVAI